MSMSDLHPQKISMFSIACPAPTLKVRTQVSDQRPCVNCFHDDPTDSRDIDLTETIPALLFLVLADKIANRRNTSEQVTNIDKQINTIMIHVSLDILLSAMKSDKISARSKKTRQRSFSTCILGLISRYSRTAR
jgi:hypothetical protein